MSEALIASLQARVNDQQAEINSLKSEAKDRRIKGKKYQKDLDEATAKLTATARERDDFKAKAESSNPELTGKIAELEGVIRTGKHRAAFDRAAGEAGVDPKATATLWKVLEYKAESDEPDQAVIDAAIAGAKEVHSYLFRPAETPPANDPTPKPTDPPARLTVPLKNDRGGGNLAPNAFRVTKADYGDPKWMKANSSKIAEHQKAGTLVFAD